MGPEVPILTPVIPQAPSKPASFKVAGCLTIVLFAFSLSF